MTTEANLKLPEGTRNAVANLAVDRRHPGLQLDKFIPPGKQEAQKRALDNVLLCQGDNALLNELRARRREMLTGLSALSWSATTAGALTLHLSRASALENAGICMHPLYGFAYLPGSGLKGMARAYAETVWLQAETDRPQGEVTIARVFGRAPKGKAPGSAGSVVFHDAWPETWPRLIVDIVNNHHKKYYRGEDAPGDWESPEPSYFLAVPAGLAFLFALSPRRAGDDADLALARGWLNGALCHLGAGAKTAAGYGAFRLAEEPPPSPAQVVKDESKWAEWSGTLELVTPAFLAGANQQVDDCDLRPATLRGLLRWWWRTMHSGHVDVDTLRALEAAVWGSTAAGSPVRVEVHPAGVEKRLFHLKQLGRNKKGQETLVLNQIESQKHSISSPKGGAVPGVLYAAFGIDEMDAGDLASRKTRFCAEAGSRWVVMLKARASRYPAGAERAEKHIVILAPLILEQAKAALSLLCDFGGVGSRARKGFGSFKDINGPSVDECKKAAERFRAACGMAGTTRREAEQVETPALENMIPFADVKIGTSDPWRAADKLGAVLQSFNRDLTDKQDRRALGLPRAQMTAPKGNRHAAPMHFHFSKSDDGALALRVAAFPAPNLPNLARCRSVIENLLSCLSTQFSSASQKKTLRPGLIFAKGDDVENKTTGERATVCDDVRIGANKMDIDYGGRDFDKTNPADWRLCNNP